VGRSIQSIEVCSKSSGKKEAEKNFTVSVKTPNGTEEKATLKGTAGMARLRGSVR
jgi:DnaJ-class molecular chaperone